MSLSAAISIGDRSVGPGYPAYLVAEIGINHNAEMDLARQMIDAAKLAGADAVKFQNYRTEDFVPTRDEMYTYISQGKEVCESQHDMFQRYELSDGQVGEIADYCREQELDFHSTPTNKNGVALLKSLGVGVLKNGSDFLSNLPLIRQMAQSGLPTVLSTGMAMEEDIEEAVDSFRDAGGKELILLHCVSQYPAPIAELNLLRISALADRFGCLAGFSDHSEGTLAAEVSVSLGACWIEKHFTLDRGLPGPDHRFSSDPAEFAELAKRVRAAESALGAGGVDAMSKKEEGSRKSYRLSCAAACDLETGSVLGADDIAFFRPGTGFSPSRHEDLLGRVLACAVKRGDLFTEDHFK